MKDLFYRFKYLFQGNFWAFWHYERLGFTELRYRGKPIILRDDMPKDEFLIHQKDGTWKLFNLKTRRVGKLKPVHKMIIKTEAMRG